MELAVDQRVRTNETYNNPDYRDQFGQIVSVEPGSTYLVVLPWKRTDDGGAVKIIATAGQLEVIQGDAEFDRLWIANLTAQTDANVRKWWQGHRSNPPGGGRRRKTRKGRKGRTTRTLRRKLRRS